MVASNPGLVMFTELIPSESIKFPGIIPNEFSGPGPSNTTVLSFLFSANTTNSVPRAPSVPEGNFTSKFSGFFLLIWPVMNLTDTDFTLETKDHS